MGYVRRINELLRPATGGPLVVDLFAGCGGLALGFEAHGFQTHGFEVDEDACTTYTRNLLGECSQIRLTTKTQLPEAAVVIGGPPCQPYSVAGNQKGSSDERDGFPIFISAVRRLKPEIFLFENVRGVFYRNREYLESVVVQLSDLGYVVEPPRLMNAVHFGVPQNRERVIVVGHRGRFGFPAFEKRKTPAGEAVAEWADLAPPESRFLTESMDRYIAVYEKKSQCIRPRDLHMDRSSRTLTCRNLAGATADMMRVRLPDGRRRMLLLREAARLQSFPDWFEFSGTESSQFKQVGNAVAPLFAWHLAKQVREYLASSFRLPDDEIVLRRPKTHHQFDLFALNHDGHA
jgi:DNA (cytosine-5)-methyltransferase 1